MRLVHLILASSILVPACAEHEIVRKDELQVAPPAANAAPVSVGETAPVAAPVEALPAPTAAAGEELDDAKILEVAHVANARAIERAQLAAQRATDPRVRELAQAIAIDRTKADQRGKLLAKERNLSPAESRTSNRLKDDAQQAIDGLSMKTGRDFDVAYVEAQVDAEQSVLRLFDQRLIPSATDEYVRALVRSIRPEVAKHFEEAKNLELKLKE